MKLLVDPTFQVACVNVKAHDVQFVEDNHENIVWMMHSYPWFSYFFMLGFPNFDNGL
jgi:glycyl-tRNA synthetase alpha subunit